MTSVTILLYFDTPDGADGPNVAQFADPRLGQAVMDAVKAYGFVRDPSRQVWILPEGRAGAGKDGQG